MNFKYSRHDRYDWKETYIDLFYRILLKIYLVKSKFTIFLIISYDLLKKL